MDLDLNDITFILKILKKSAIIMGEDLEQAYRTVLKLQALHKDLSRVPLDDKN